MDEEEAIEQMELLGHDFFLFFNVGTGQMNLLYRRRNGNYGLIEPELT
jgi:putative sigma-54 modulation protein